LCSGKTKKKKDFSIRITTDAEGDVSRFFCTYGRDSSVWLYTPDADPSFHRG
jgi:hypothetical protein